MEMEALRKETAPTRPSAEFPAPAGRGRRCPQPRAPGSCPRWTCGLVPPLFSCCPHREVLQGGAAGPCVPPGGFGGTGRGLRGRAGDLWGLAQAGDAENAPLLRQAALQPLDFGDTPLGLRGVAQPGPGAHLEHTWSTSGAHLEHRNQGGPPRYFPHLCLQNPLRPPYFGT